MIEEEILNRCKERFAAPHWCAEIRVTLSCPLSRKERAANEV